MEILEKTQSICPKCHKVIEAEYIEQDGTVYFEKTCPDCGTFSTVAGNDPFSFLDWINHPVINVPPGKALTEGCGEGKSECPLHCGTCTDHLQTACCIIINVTKRCNQHCPYCFARADEDDFSDSEPSLEELGEKFDFLKKLGEERPFNIQLSGGEPTVRDDLPEIIRLAVSKGFEYIQINTNGRRLAEEKGYAEALRGAGASVVFMQFDGTRDDIYMATRGEKLYEMKLRAISNCRRAGLPVTIVPTIVRGINLDNIGEMLEFVVKNVDVVKGIHFQPVSYFGRCPEGSAEVCRSMGSTYPERVTMFDVMREIEKQSRFFKYDDFCPINTGHPLCCFYSTYLREGPDSVKCLVSEKTKALGTGCCNQGEMTDHDALSVIRKDRDFVLKKWRMENPLPEKDEDDKDFDPLECFKEEPKVQLSDCLGIDEDRPMDMDEFLKYYRSNTFTVTGMAFMDSSNLDAERLKRCRVQVLSDDNRLVPFCGHTGFEE